MISAISSALGGLQAATGRLERAASTIATAPVNAADTGNSPDTSGSTGRPIDSGALFDQSDTFAGALIDAKLAEISYKANLAVLRVADNLTEELLDITT